MLASIRALAITACAVVTFATAPSSMASDIDQSSMNVTPAPTVAAPIEVAPARPASLRELVDARTDTEAPNADQECIAAAVYFEARGEPIEGQLAVAEVVLNRAASGKYPASICAVVKQPAQFSFVRRGRIPPVAKATEAWRKAVAIAHVAVERLAQQIGSGVLWYHANYVSPGWGSRLTRVTQIGAHIFYGGSG